MASGSHFVQNVILHMHSWLSDSMPCHRQGIHSCAPGFVPQYDVQYHMLIAIFSGFQIFKCFAATMVCVFGTWVKDPKVSRFVIFLAIVVWLMSSRMRCSYSVGQSVVELVIRLDDLSINDRVSRFLLKHLC